MNLKRQPTLSNPSGSRRSVRRGLTLIELMLALSVTVMVAGAISGMMEAVSAGVMDRSDSRSLMIRASAADSKLSAYVSPARAVWSITANSVVIWLNDNRQSGTIHATEVRWFMYDASAGTLDVRFVKFPDEWSQVTRDMVDIDYPKASDPAQLYDKYLKSGYIASMHLLDGLEGFSAVTDQNVALDSTHVTFTLTFTGSDEPFQTTVPVSIAHHQAPVS